VSASRGLVDTSLDLGGVPGIALEGDVLYVTLFPEVGGKILDLMDALKASLAKAS